MEFHPWIFALITYGLAAVIAVCVAFIVKIIAAIVQRKKTAADEGPAESKGGGG
ncbi:MAG: hypothetical protein JXA51_04975 [Dehalococcoidales bacterium]|nr:hypothetical protein [Dehalococcoidales bacterium]